MFEFGEMYEKGIYVEKDEEKAVALYQKAADEHYDLAVCKLIQFYTDKGDTEHAAYWTEKKREWDRKALEEMLNKKDGFCSVWEQALYKSIQDDFAKKEV